MNAAVTRSLLPVCRDFPAGRPRKRVRPLQLPSAVCVRLRLPLRPCIPALSPGFYGGTAPPGVAEHVTMEDSGMSIVAPAVYVGTWRKYNGGSIAGRSEEHTSELQSRFDLVCRLLLEKKNRKEMKLFSEPGEEYRGE